MPSSVASHSAGRRCEARQMDNEARVIAAFSFVVVMLFAAFWIVYGGSRADAARRRRFDRRKDISLDEFLRDCGDPESFDRELVAELLGDISRAIGVPSGKLRAVDRFGAELAPEKGWEPDDAIYIVTDKWATRLARATGLSAPAGAVESLGDLVRKSCARAANRADTD